jgi:3-oxoacyl-[acyl-carrier protein] reductase
MPTTLEGKVAFVTGGSRGIGAAIARRLAADGAHVVLTYTGSKAAADDVARSIGTAGGRASAVQVDSADAAALARAIADAATAHGRLDILVNNAGVAIIKPIDELTVEDFDKTMAINVRAVFVASREAARHMREGGRIVTIGSTNADRMPFAGGAVYAMSKAAVAGFTRGLARDLGPRAITVNAVQPGPVDTDMNPADGPFAQTLKGLMALPRYGKTSEIAGLVAYLAGPESAYVTGACLTIDGGFAA